MVKKKLSQRAQNGKYDQKVNARHISMDFKQGKIVLHSDLLWHLTPALFIVLPLLVVRVRFRKRRFVCDLSKFICFQRCYGSDSIAIAWYCLICLSKYGSCQLQVKHGLWSQLVLGFRFNYRSFFYDLNTFPLVLAGGRAYPDHTITVRCPCIN